MNSTTLLQLHIPQSTPSLDVSSGVPSSSSSASNSSFSLSNHLSQLQSPSRHELVQGEMLGMYLIVPPTLLEKHRWLALPWGPKLQRLEREKRLNRSRRSQYQSEESADAGAAAAEFDEKKEEEKQKVEDEAVLQKLQPCPLHLRLALRVVPESEVSQYAPEFSSAHLRLTVNGPEDDNDDDGADIIHDADDASSSSDSDDNSSSDTDSSTDSDSTSEEDMSGESKKKPQQGRSYSVSVVTSPSNALASTRSPSNSTTSASASSARLAFRKSTLPTVFPASTRSHKHHPSKLAPGYAPPSARGTAKQEQLSAWNHAQNDSHTMPAVGNHDVTAPPAVYYFYTDQLPPTPTNPSDSNPEATAESTAAAASSSSPSSSSSTAVSSTTSTSAFPYGSLVLYIETSISILPNFLSSCNRIDPAHVLAMEVDLLAPAAKHHTFLRDCTVALPNTDAFLLEGAVPGAGLDSSVVKYWSLRGFVSKNRALQVPHSIPPVKYYLTVHDPIHLSCKAINLSNGGGSGASEDLDSDASNQQALSMGGDVALEFIVRNVSHEWSVDVHRFDFMLDRTRMFLKIVSSAIESSPSPRSAATSPSSSRTVSRAASPTSASMRAHQKIGSTSTVTTTTTIVKEQRSIHSIPLGSYFELQADESSLPAVLAPLEELHLLAFLSAPQGTKLSQLESLIRDCLHASGSQSAGSFSFLAAGAALPFRTPWSVSYSVQDVGKQGSSQICSQNKVMWKSRCYAHSQMMQSSPAAAPTGALPLRIKEKDKSLVAPTPHHRTQLSSSVAVVQAPQQLLQSPHASLISTLSQLKLSLRLKMPSPVPLHALFPIFISVTNHSSMSTPHLQVVILPPSHPLVAKSIEMQREEEQKLSHRRQQQSGGAAEFTSPMNLQDSSIDVSLNPVPPYLYHPSTPFSSNTPFMIDQLSSPYSSGSDSHGRQFIFPSIEAQLTSRRPAGWPSLMNSSEDSLSSPPPPPPPMRHLSSTGSEDVLTSSVSQFLNENASTPTVKSTRNKVQPLLHELQREQEFTAKQGSEGLCDTCSQKLRDLVVVCSLIDCDLLCDSL